MKTILILKTKDVVALKASQDSLNRAVAQFSQAKELSDKIISEIMAEHSMPEGARAVGIEGMDLTVELPDGPAA